MTPARVRLGSTVLVAGLLAAACSSSGSGTPKQPPAHNSSTTTSTSSSSTPAGRHTSGSAAASTITDVCTALPAATLTHLTGVKFTKAHADKLPQSSAGAISTCNYTGGLGVQLDVTAAKSSYASQLFQTDYSTNKQVLSKTAMVSGIGDKAFTAHFASMWLEVLWGDEQLQINGATNLEVDTAKKVLTALHDNL